MELLSSSGEFEPDFGINARSENINTEIYVGTKIIKAKPMTSDDFKIEKGQSIGNDENQEGYRVQYDDGYVSWSPKSVFERCYRLLSQDEIRVVQSFIL